MSRIKIFSGCRKAHRGILAIILVVAVGFSSCKREILKPELVSNYEILNFGEVFNAFWNGVNSNYLFWDQETVNWDSMYRAYKPKFDSLDMLNYSEEPERRPVCFSRMAGWRLSV